MLAEVVARHGIKIDANDPMMAVVTMNELAMAQLINPVIERKQSDRHSSRQSYGCIVWQARPCHKTSGRPLRPFVRKSRCPGGE